MSGRNSLLFRAQVGLDSRLVLISLHQTSVVGELNAPGTKATRL